MDTRITRASRLAILALALTSGAAQAVTIVSDHFEAAGGNYTMGLTAVLEAPPAVVWSALTDYNHLNRYSSAMKTSRLLERNGCRAEVESTMEGCVAFFCRTVERVERMVEHPPHVIKATVDPERSDLHHGTTVWRFYPAGSGTRLVIRAEMNPDFWVPPLIGKHLIRRNFLRGTTRLLQAIEDESDRLPTTFAKHCRPRETP